MVRCARNTDAHSEIDFPFWRKIKVYGRESLMFLQPNGIEVGCRPDGPVVLDPAGDVPGEVVGEFDVWRENESLMRAGPVERFVECGVEREIPLVDLLIDDRAHLPGPGVRGILRPLIANFVGKAQADGPFPFGRDADARAN